MIVHRNTVRIDAGSVVSSKIYRIYIYKDRVRAHACKHSERGGRDKSTTDVTARRSHRLEQKEEEEEEEEKLETRYRDPPIGQRVPTV